MVYVQGRYKIQDYLGKRIRIFLKTGGAFTVDLVSKAGDYVTGYDEEGTEITIDTNDIDFVVDEDWKG